MSKLYDYVEEPTGLKYFEVDSTFRNRNIYLNPCDFVIPVMAAQGVVAGTYQDPILLSTPYSGIQNYTGLTYIQGFTGATGSGIPVNVILDSKETLIDNFYIGSYLEIDKIPKQISQYIGITKTATIESQYPIMPSTGTEYIIRKKPSFFDTDVSIIGVNQQLNTVTSLNLLHPNPSPLKDFYKNAFITFTNGLHEGENSLVTSYTPLVNIPAFQQPTSFGSSEFLNQYEKGYVFYPRYEGYLTNIILQAYVKDLIFSFRTVRMRIRQGTTLNGPIIYETTFQLAINLYTSLVSIDISGLGPYLTLTNYVLTFTDISSDLSSGFIQLFGIEPSISYQSLNSIVYPKISINSIITKTDCWSQPTAAGASTILSQTNENGYTFPWIPGVGGPIQIRVMMSCFAQLPSVSRLLQVKIYQGTGISGLLIYASTFTITTSLLPLLTTLSVNTTLMTTPPNQYTISLRDVSLPSNYGFIQIFGYSSSEISSPYSIINSTTFPTSDASNATTSYSMLSDLTYRDFIDPSTTYGFFFSPSVSGKLIYINILLTSYDQSGIRTLRCRIKNGAGIGFPTIASVDVDVPNTDRQIVQLSFGNPNLIGGNDYTLTIDDISSGGSLSGIVYFYGIPSDLTFTSYNTSVYPQLSIFCGTVGNIVSQPNFPSIMSPVGNIDQGFLMLSLFSGNLTAISFRLTSFEGVSSGRTIFLKILDGSGLAAPVIYSDTFTISNTSGIIDYYIQLNVPYPAIIAQNFYTIVINDTTAGGTLTGGIFFFGINPTSQYTSYSFPLYPKLTVDTPSAIITLSPPKNLSKFVGGNADNIEFNIQALENSNTLKYNSLPISRTAYWAIGLKFLIIPNKLIGVSIGGKLDAYPHIYVELYNDGFVGSQQTEYSNNPNSNLALFRVAIDKYIYDSPRDFFTLKNKGAPQIVKFRPDQNTRFRLRLPDGTILQWAQQDYTSPQTPNQFLQVFALFTLWPYNFGLTLENN